MAQLFFKYGTMSCGKSLDLITTAYNYDKQGKNVIVYTSATDTRSEQNTVQSRTGHKWTSRYLPLTEAEILEDIEGFKRTLGKINCILVDESQFLTEEQVVCLADIVDEYNIPVICWGLKNDFQNKLFEGTKALLTYADKLECLKTICTVCDRKATMNLRLSEGRAIYHGEQIMVGDLEYIPVCRHCFNHYNEIKNKA